MRWWVHFLKKQDEWREKIDEAMKKGYAALGVMDRQLARSPFLAGDAFTIADIALYAYTHVAHQGGYDLSRFPAVSAWLQRVTQQPRFEAMVA